MSWNYKNKIIKSLEDIPKDCIGFIYRIDNLTNGKFYIGKKDLFHVTNPQISMKLYNERKAKGLPVTKTKNKAKSKPGKPVWRYKAKNVTKETDWISYVGSNKELIQDIKKGHSIVKTIIRFCTDKRELTMREVEAQFKEEVLFRCDCYNGNILAKFFKQVKC